MSATPPTILSQLAFSSSWRRIFQLAEIGTPADVSNVVGALAGEPGGSDWIGIFEFGTLGWHEDRIYTLVCGGCGAGGWTDDASASAVSSRSLERLVTLGLTRRDQRRLLHGRQSVLSPGLRALLEENAG